MSKKNIVRVCAILFLAASLALFGNRVVTYTYEEIMIAIDPSAKRVFEYGSRHLDSEGGMYIHDLPRAEQLLRRALIKDPYYPYAHHQLARIAFLRGDFMTALSYIAIEIKLYGEKHHNAYYIKGLIEGYAGNYASAISDYESYLEHDPRNWAALNDLAWVLLKHEQYERAEEVTTEGLSYFPDNPWLFNSRGIARFENGKYDEAREDFQKAVVLVQDVTNEEWSTAYPGNDPRIAGQGVETLTRSIRENLGKTTLRLSGKEAETKEGIKE